MSSRRHSRRFWLLIVVGLLMAMLLSAHGIWSAVSSRSLDARIAELRAQGEPVFPDDFAPKQPDGPDNGGRDIERAITLIDVNSPAWKTFDDLDPAPPLRPEERAALQSLVHECAAVFDALEQARAKPRADYYPGLKSPVAQHIVHPSMNGVRSLCNLTCGAALLDHDQAKDASALHNIEQAIFVSRYIDQHPSLIGHLVSVGCVALATNRAMAIAPDLRIGNRAGEASPKDVRHTIDMLLDDAPQHDGVVRALRGERMIELDTFESIIEGVPINLQGGPAPTRYHWYSRYLLAPILHNDAVFMLNYTSNSLSALKQANFPAAAARLPPAPPRSALAPFASILIPAYARAIETHYRGMTDRRLAAIALAIRSYSVDHDGHPPEKLEDLVPHYLPVVPLDPLAKGQPLKYIPETASPIIYSVGPNAIDEAGSEAAARRGRRFATSEWDTLDRVVHLTRQPRPAPEKPADESPAEITKPPTRPASAPS